MQKQQEFSPHFLRPKPSLSHPSTFELNVQGPKKKSRFTYNNKTTKIYKRNVIIDTTVGRYGTFVHNLLKCLLIQP